VSLVNFIFLSLSPVDKKTHEPYSARFMPRECYSVKFLKLLEFINFVGFTNAVFVTIFVMIS